MFLFTFLFIRIPLPDVGYIDTAESQKVSKHEEAWYYVHMNKRYSFETLTSHFGIPENQTLPISKNTFSCLLTHNVAESLSKNKDFWVKKIPSKHKLAKSATGFYSTLCPRSCELPGRVIVRTDFYAVFEYHGPVEALAKTTCARMFAPYANNIELQARFHRGITHNFTYATETDPSQPYYSKSRAREFNLTGNEQCIAVIDSGVDNSSAWFERESLLYDAKIFTTYNLGDDLDDYEGHGTFVAGIAAGKAICSDYAKSFNGVAEDAKILVVDIKNQTSGQLAFPEDLLDLYEPCIQLKCPITLNAWTSDDPLMATALDVIAFNHPMLTMIFPSVKDENGRIKTPGDAKNVLSVGSSYGHPGSKAFFQTGTPVTIYNERTKEFSFGYTDKSGTPLLNSTYTQQGEMTNVTIGNKNGEVGVILEQGEMLSHFKSSCCVLVFHTGNLHAKVNFPVIRVPSSKKGNFAEGDKLRILSSPESDEGPSAFTRVDKSNGYFDKTIPFYAKPEIVTPGGPMAGPKAGSNKCGLEGLTIKEGPSISAAVVAGDAAIVRQFLSNGTLKGVKHISAAAIRGTLACISHDLYAQRTKGPFLGIGFGTPQIEDLLQDGYNITVFQNRTINSDSRQDFCLEAVGDGVVKIALVWNDFPRDPKSHYLLTQPLHLSVAMNENPYSHILSNINDEDQPTLDMYNTVQLVTTNVKKGNRLRISVTAGYFAIPKPAMFTLTLFGPIKTPENLSCTGYFISGNCPRGCDGRGSTCNHNKLCVCGFDRGGDFCSFRADRINSDSTQRVTLTKRFEWKFFKFVPDSWKPGSSLKVIFEDVDFTRIGFFMHVGTMPKWDDYLCSERYCPWADRSGNTITFKYEDWEFITKQHAFAFGFFAKTRFPCKFVVRFELHQSNDV